MDVWSVVEGSVTAIKQSEFKTKDQKAQMVIGTTVGASQVTHIKHCATASEMWAALMAIYESLDEVSKARLSALFWNFKISAEDSIMNSVSRLKE